MRRAIFLGLFILTSCKANAGSEAYIKIVGHISQKTVRLVKSAPRSVSKVLISSQGGDTKAAIEVARLIRARGYTLVVKKYCLSACAQWLMPAAKNVLLDDTPIIAMHHSATAFQKLLKEAGKQTEAEKYAEVAALEQAFYEEIGVDKVMLTYPYHLTIPICFRSSFEIGSPYAIFAAKWNFVALSAKSYRKFTGQLPVGKWAETPEDLEKYRKRYMPRVENISIISEMAALRTFDLIDLKPLPSCETILER